MRFVPLLLALTFTSAALAQNAGVSVSLSMPSTAVYEDSTGYARASGHATITNAGSVAAQNVTVVFDSAMYLTGIPGFSCPQVNGHIECTAASLAPGSVSVDVTASWHNAAPGTVETTTVTAGNSSASANITIILSANLQLQDIGDFGSIATDYLDVGVSFVNYGPSRATDFKLTFTVPQGLGFAGVSNDLGGETMTCTTPPIGQSGDVVCTLPSFSTTEGYATEYVTVQIPRSTPVGTVFHFNATLTSSDAVKSPQTATGSVQVAAANDLSVVMTSPPAVVPGASYDNTVVVTNNGPGTPPHVYVSVKFTGGIFPTTPAAPAGWTCQASSSTGSCSTDSPLPPGASATLTFPGSAPPTVATGTKTQTATVTAANDLTSNNNTSVTTTTVQAAPQTDAAVSISGPNVVHTGDLATYTVQITNTGSTAVLDVALSAQVPGTLLSSSCGGPAAATCSFASINPGATATASFFTRIGATTGTLTASATVTARNVTGQRSASTTTTNAGEPNVDLEPVLTAPALVKPGAGLSAWTIGIVNHGPDTAHGWSLVFTIAGDATIPAVAALIDTTVSCQVTTPKSVLCTGTDLGTSPFSVTVQVIVAASAADPIHATLTASTANHDLHPENDVVTADTAIPPPGPDLVLTMTPAFSTLQAGMPEVFTIHVLNDGNVTAASTVLVIPLLPEFALAAPSFCGGDTTVMVCNLGSLDPGNDRRLDFLLLPAHLGTVTTTASATTSTSEPRKDNNSATVTVNVLSGPTARRRAAHH